MPRVLAVDPGERRIGIAVSDELGLLARPLVVLRGKSLRDAVRAIALLVEREQVDEIIVGLPLTLSGEVGHQARRSLRFVEELRRATPVVVREWNEQFTTVEAQRRMIEAGQRRKTRRHMLDAAAAAVLLQDYLDHRA
jgi:putative Holliday junction resolvase